MNKLVVVAALCFAGGAWAQSGKSDKPGGATAPGATASGATGSGAKAAPAAGAPMELPKPGPETKALEPFAKNMTSSGTTMGMDGKEMPTKGKATCKWINAGFWVQCDIEESAGTGKAAMKWMGHWVFGYDYMDKAYRGVMTDNMGSMMRMKGSVEGAKMSFESIDEIKGPPGMPMPSKMRFSQDATDPKNIKFVEEWYLGGKWVPHGSSTMKTSGK